jgi:hypothetical protein
MTLLENALAQRNFQVDRSVGPEGKEMAQQKTKHLSADSCLGENGKSGLPMKDAHRLCSLLATRKSSDESSGNGSLESSSPGPLPLSAVVDIRVEPSVANTPKSRPR